MKHKLFSFLLLPLLLIVTSASAFTDTVEPARDSKISEPKFGEYLVGDDYFLANYKQLIQYWDKLAQESGRIKIVEIGTTPEGRSMKIAIITSSENHKNLSRYQDISVRLAKAEGLDDAAAHKLASEGKTVVWVDGGLHATETVNSQALFTTAYDIVSRNDSETLRILDNVILLLVPANPDGMDLVSDWYMKESDPKKRNMSIPRLYQKYVGHDNNRDSYVANQLETEAINRQMYIEWIPQIMYNQHQSGPAGAVLFMAPFRDPFNYNQDPLVPIGIDLVGSVTANKTIPQLRQFVEDGGAMLAIGGSTDLAYHFGLPLTSALAEINPDGSSKKLSSDKFFIPGSVLRVKVDNTTPLAYGIPEDLDLIYRNNPVFRLLPEARLKGINAAAWFSDSTPLRSGWAWGQHYLNGGSVVVEAPLGKGKVFIFGTEITFRGQPHASFKFLFNSIYYAGATPVKL